MNEFKRVSEFDKWVEAYDVQVMPNLVRHKPSLFPPAVWLVLAIVSLTVGALVAFGT